MFTIKPCSIEDVDTIMDMQDHVIEVNNKTGRGNWYIVTERCELEDGLKNNDLLVLGAYCNDELAACIAMSVGDPNGMFKELLNNLQNNEDKQFGYAKMAIVKEAYRGHGLQRTLLHALEVEALKNPQLKYIGAIAHPDNSFSLKNLKAEGYENKGRVVPDPHPGYPRVLLFKTLDRP
ncbi:MAG: GNAT family N-acetyltransferase [Thermoguttaceae bacterium]|nr:GNAT family N-acetyltransferase [Thermoguttaceae bacterium]